VFIVVYFVVDSVDIWNIWNRGGEGRNCGV